MDTSTNFGLGMVVSLAVLVVTIAVGILGVAVNMIAKGFDSQENGRP